MFADCSVDLSFHVLFLLSCACELPRNSRSKFFEISQNARKTRKLSAKR